MVSTVWQNQEVRATQTTNTIKTLFAKAKAWIVSLADAFLSGNEQFAVVPILC